MPLSSPAISTTRPVVPPPAWSGGAVQWAADEAPRLAHSENLLITFGFHCNLACTFCLVEDGLDRLEGITPATFRSWLQWPELFRGVTRIILSGGEATLEPELFDYIAIARQVPGVQHIRIQTNGTRLHDRAYLDSLIAAGVTEFFVSVHGWDEASTAKITQRNGAFRAIVKGLEAVSASSAALLTNTCICTDNYAHLIDIVQLLTPLRPEQMSFWTLHLRVDRPDTRLAMARVGDVQPHLLRAFDLCDAEKLPALVKWFPRCLLQHHHAKHDDSQPTTLVEPTFWPTVPRYSCIYRSACTWGKQGCNGLQHPYIEAFGWEESVLQPVALANLAPAKGDQDLQLDGQELRRWQLTLQGLGIEDLATQAGWQLTAAVRSGATLRQQLRKLPQDWDIYLEFSAPHSGPAFVRTASFAISHGRAPVGAEAALAELLATLRTTVPARDVGGLRLPWHGHNQSM